MTFAPPTTEKTEGKNRFDARHYCGLKCPFKIERQSPIAGTDTVILVSMAEAIHAMMSPSEIPVAPTRRIIRC